MDVPVQPQRRVHGQEGVIAVDVHAQGQGDVGYQGADGPQADDAQSLVVQLRPDEGGLALLHHGGHIHAGGHLLPDPLDAAVHIPGAHQHGAQHQLLHGVGVGARRVEHHDARLGAAVQRDVVDAGARPGDGQEVFREVVVQELCGADQDGVLLRLGVGDGVQLRIQTVQADGGDLVECFDAVHGKCLHWGGPSGPRYLRGNVRRWHRFRRSTSIIGAAARNVNGGKRKKRGVRGEVFGKVLLLRKAKMPKTRGPDGANPLIAENFKMAHF